MPMTREERDALVVRYRDGAAAFRAALADVADAELDERPIDGEWTVREIAHHLADSELNSAVRLRRLIAEDEPVLQGYDEWTFVRRLHVTERPIASSIDAAAAARASTLTDPRDAHGGRVDPDGDARRAGPVLGRGVAPGLRQPPVGSRGPGPARPCRAARALTPRPDLPQNRRRLT